MADQLLKPTAVSEGSFEQEVLQSSTPVLVDFWAEWCPPCRAIAPVLEEIAREQTGRLRVAKVNVDENERLAVEHRVSSIPTLLLFKNGQQVERLVGYMPKAALLSRIEKHLAA